MMVFVAVVALAAVFVAAFSKQEVAFAVAEWEAQ
jgi:hypothetical protein